MGKARLARNTVIGAAIVGAVVYALSRSKRGKDMRDDLRGFMKDLLARKKALGKISKTAYEQAVDSAARIYRGSRDMTARETTELKSLATDLKRQWKSTAPKRKK